MARYASRYVKYVETVYPAEDVFGAACAAQRINGEYIKGVRWPDVAPADKPQPLSNKALMRQLLERKTQSTGEYISEDDMAQGRLVRSSLQQLTFKIIRGEVLNEFEKSAMSVCEKETLSTSFELGVVCSLPASYVRGLVRKTVEQRIAFSTGGFVGRIGDKVTLTVEVLKSIYSQTWTKYYITGITPDDQPIFFALGTKVEDGSMITVTGNVKAHTDDGKTQLNRVKVK